ncbi:MAG TPA: cytochrome P450 [Mycobacteriales bacterium]|nr:cytochrome P450 [Mycobacteriales bacterium]
MQFDPTSSALVSNPYPLFAAMRASTPVLWHDGLGMFLTFRHADADAVLRDRRLGRVWRMRWPEESLPAYALLHLHSMLENEPPVHTRLRRLVAGAFGRGHVERMRRRIAAIASGLADAVADAGADGSVVDLLPPYAEPLPVAVIADLLGVPPSDRGLLRPWSNAIVKMYEYGVTGEQRATAERAAAEYVAYVRSLIAWRRREPGEDLLSSLIATRDADGSRLTEDELVATAVLLQMAGHEASVNVVGNGVLALLRWPGELARLRADPALVPTAVEELIRYDSPLQLFERTAVSDAVIGDVPILAGAKVAALLGAANRDPDVFAEPDRLDVGRADNPHIGFGAGIHYCLGAPLARVELQVSLATLLTRFPRLALAGEPTRRPEFVIRGLSSLPVTT